MNLSITRLEHTQKVNYAQNDNQAHSQQNAAERPFISGLQRDTISVPFTGKKIKTPFNSLVKNFISSIRKKITPFDDLVAKLSSLYGKSIEELNLNERELNKILKAIELHSEQLLSDNTKYKRTFESISKTDNVVVFENDLTTIFAYLLLPKIGEGPQSIPACNEIMKKVIEKCPIPYIEAFLKARALNRRPGTTIKTIIGEQVHLNLLNLLLNRILNEKMPLTSPAFRGENILEFDKFEKQVSMAPNLEAYMNAQCSRDYFNELCGAATLNDEEIKSHITILESLGLRKYLGLKVWKNKFYG